MNLRVARLWTSPKSTQGQLFVDGNFYCYTLEPPLQSENPSCPHPAIPEGTFKAVMAVSPHFTSIFGREIKVPHLQNVPGRSDIEIHMGNYPEQTKGCIILGHVRDEDSVGDSDTAFFNLMNIVPEEFEVTVE